MSDTTWFRVASTSNGRVVVLAVGDPYVDGGTVKHRNHRVEIRLNDDTVDHLELSGTESREVAKLLNDAATHIEGNQ